ncbi:MAG: succinate dehydrogenase cytochrome b subunit [Candidatus Omnitrophota bacterium]|nr:succinate dehydrogenase cytochrome b subunit [Candidatus Omnitrophota bacterium]
MLAAGFTKSSVGKKLLMAATGLMLFGFVVGHLLGNLQIFLGAKVLNEYAVHLLELGPLLWLMRGGLLTALILHIGLAVNLALENRKARPTGYSFRASVQTTYAARTMMVSGVIILAYVVYHLLHFTFRVTNPEISSLHDAAGHHDVYAMVVLSFKDPVISGVYILAQLLLASHLSHGFGSMFQSLGWICEGNEYCMKKVSLAIGALIGLGYISIPAAVLLNMLTVPGGAG